MLGVGSADFVLCGQGQKPSYNSRREYCNEILCADNA